MWTKFFFLNIFNVNTLYRVYLKWVVQIVSDVSKLQNIEIKNKKTIFIYISATLTKVCFDSFVILIPTLFDIICATYSFLKQLQRRITKVMQFSWRWFNNYCRNSSYLVQYFVILKWKLFKINFKLTFWISASISWGLLWTLFWPKQPPIFYLRLCKNVIPII